MNIIILIYAFGTTESTRLTHLEMDTKIITMIVDDNPNDITTLVNLLASMEPRIQVIATETDGFRARQYLKSKYVQLLFLDAEMPGLNGITLMKSLIERPRVILTTAYPHYAMDAYALGVGDCIPKPIEWDRLAIALDRTVGDLLGNPSGGTATDFIMVPELDTGAIIKLYFADILAVGVSHNDLTFYLPMDKVITRMSLKELLERLPGNRFVQVHRSFAVDVKKVLKFDKKNLLLEMQGLATKIPVSRTYYNEFMALFLPHDDSDGPGGAG